MRSDLPGGSVQGVEFTGQPVPYPNQSAFNGGEDGPPPLALRTFIGPSYPVNDDIPQGNCVCKGQGGADGPCSNTPGSLFMAPMVNSRSGGVANVFEIEGFVNTRAILAGEDWPRTAKLSWKWEGFLETVPPVPDVDLQPENSFCTGGGNVEVRQYRNLNGGRFLLQFNDVTILTARMPDLRLFLDHGGNNSCNDDTMCGESVQPVSDFSIAEDLSGTNRLLAETLLEEIGNQGFQIQAFIFDRIERTASFPIFLGVDAPWVENGRGFHAMELVPVP